jgi:hypothetical protein
MGSSEQSLQTDSKGTNDDVNPSDIVCTRIGIVEWSVSLVDSQFGRTISDSLSLVKYIQHAHDNALGMIMTWREK